MPSNKKQVRPGSEALSLPRSKTTTQGGPASHLEKVFSLQVRALKLPVPELEYRFHPVRRWRFDFAWPEIKVAVEVEGGTGARKGRHVRPQGFRNDCEKYCTAAVMGWMVLRGDSKMVMDGSLVAFAERAINEQKNS